MMGEAKIPLYKLLVCLSDAADLVSPRLLGHHRQVAYIALKAGRELNLPQEQLFNLTLAGILHDVGAFSLQERLADLQGAGGFSSRHTETGFLLLKEFEPLEGAAELIRLHHLPWEDGRGASRIIKLVR